MPRITRIPVVHKDHGGQTEMTEKALEHARKKGWRPTHQKAVKAPKQPEGSGEPASAGDESRSESAADDTTNKES